MSDTTEDAGNDEPGNDEDAHLIAQLRAEGGDLAIMAADRIEQLRDALARTGVVFDNDEVDF